MALPFAYRLIRSRRRQRTTAVSIGEDGQVVVQAPWWASPTSIEEFLLEKAGWINRKILQVKKNVRPAKTYLDGEPLPFLGRTYPLRHCPLPYIQKPRLNFQDEQFQLILPAHFSAREATASAQRLLQDWHLRYGKKYLAERVHHYTSLLRVSCNRVCLKKVSSIWGSCSAKNNLNFNRKLVMAPPEIIDYVVIHEACHLIHRHHRKSFWALVESLDPHYKTHKQWLKENHYLLTL